MISKIIFLSTFTFALSCTAFSPKTTKPQSPLDHLRDYLLYSTPADKAARCPKKYAQFLLMNKKDLKRGIFGYGALSEELQKQVVIHPKVRAYVNGTVQTVDIAFVNPFDTPLNNAVDVYVQAQKIQSERDTELVPAKFIIGSLALIIPPDIFLLLGSGLSLFAVGLKGIEMLSCGRCEKIDSMAVAVGSTLGGGMAAGGTYLFVLNARGPHSGGNATLYDSIYWIYKFVALGIVGSAIKQGYFSGDLDQSRRSLELEKLSRKMIKKELKKVGSKR